jgi:excisionase family DNA binding protein
MPSPLCRFVRGRNGNEAAYMDGKNRILTKKEAARRLGVSERTLDRMCSTDGGLRKIQLSPRRVGFGEQNVDSYIEQLLSAA